MPRVDALDLTFTPEAKVEVVAFLAGIRDFPPTLSLMKARASGDSEDRWTYGAYAPRNLDVVGFELEAIGHPLLYSVEGIDGLFEAYSAKSVIHPNGRLELKPWGVREFSILDFDGNLVTFQQAAA